jgi:hypothetical protein
MPVQAAIPQRFDFTTAPAQAHLWWAGAKRPFYQVRGQADPALVEHSAGFQQDPAPLRQGKNNARFSQDAQRSLVDGFYFIMGQHGQVHHRLSLQAGRQEGDPA